MSEEKQQEQEAKASSAPVQTQKKQKETKPERLTFSRLAAKHILSESEQKALCVLKRIGSEDSLYEEDFKKHLKELRSISIR